MIVRTESSRVIMDYLNLNTIVNLNIKGIIENEPEAEIYVDDECKPSGILVRSGYFNYIYTENDSFLDEVLEKCFSKGEYGFSGVSRELADKIRKRYAVEWESRCDLYYFPEGKIDLSLIKNPVKSVDMKDAETINEYYTYRDSSSFDEIKSDIEKRPSSAVYVNGEIASWVLVHKDNSMGIMYTRDEYRGKGYAVDVSIDLANKIINSGKTPYLQIVESNNMSPGLAIKCGFEKCGKADWFGIIV